MSAAFGGGNHVEKHPEAAGCTILASDVASGDADADIHGLASGTGSAHVVFFEACPTAGLGQQVRFKKG